MDGGPRSNHGGPRLPRLLCEYHWRFTRQGRVDRDISACRAVRDYRQAKTELERKQWLLEFCRSGRGRSLARLKTEKAPTTPGSGKCWEDREPGKARQTQRFQSHLLFA